MNENLTKPNGSRVTIADVARESGVSPATVSLTLRGKPGVSPETRQRVLDSAQMLGYIVNPPSAAAEGSISSLGLLMKIRPNDELSSNHFYAPVLAGIESFCRQRQINLFYAQMPVDEDNNLLEAPRLLQKQEADGLLIVGAWLHEPMVQFLQKQSTPVVLVDAYAIPDVYDAVVTDNETGAYQATRYLIDNGHRHIAIVGSLPQAYPSIQQRRGGYLRALAEQGLEPHFIDSYLDPRPALPATLAYLQQHTEVSALFCCNDEISVEVMRALQAQGKRLPDELSVVGFDNIALAQHVSPALTTMRVDKMGMGRLAAQLLVNRIDFQEAGQVRAIMRPELIERRSVKTIDR